MKPGYILILICYFFTGTVQAQSSKLKITKLTRNFYVYTTFNTFDNVAFPANGMYAVTRDGVVMIDTPWDTTQFQPLLDIIEQKHCQKVKLCISTHSHDDRTGGLEYYASKGITTFTSTATDVICAAKNEKRARFTFENDTTFTLGHLTFETFHPGPGHTPDNIVIYFKYAKVLYGGCFVKSTEAMDLGNLADANVPEWKNSILKVIKKYKRPRYIIPGQQDWNSREALYYTQKLIGFHLSKKE